MRYPTYIIKNNVNMEELVICQTRDKIDLKSVVCIGYFSDERICLIKF